MTVFLSIPIEQYEKDHVFVVISEHQHETISVNTIAKLAEYNPNRVRFIVEELLNDGVIKRITVKNYNKKYKRYQYEVCPK